MRRKRRRLAPPHRRDCRAYQAIYAYYLTRDLSLHALPKALVRHCQCTATWQWPCAASGPLAVITDMIADTQYTNRAAA